MGNAHWKACKQLLLVLTELFVSSHAWGTMNRHVWKFLRGRLLWAVTCLQKEVKLRPLGYIYWVDVSWWQWWCYLQSPVHQAWVLNIIACGSERATSNPVVSLYKYSEWIKHVSDSQRTHTRSGVVLEISLSRQWTALALAINKITMRKYTKKNTKKLILRQTNKLDVVKIKHAKTSTHETSNLNLNLKHSAHMSLHRTGYRVTRIQQFW